MLHGLKIPRTACAYHTSISEEASSWRVNSKSSR
jgi:hypothetical protein